MSKRAERKQRHLDPLPVLRGLRTHELPPALRRRVLALGAGVIPELIALIEAQLAAREAEGSAAREARIEAQDDRWMADLDEAVDNHDDERLSAVQEAAFARWRDGDSVSCTDWPAAHAVDLLADVRASEVIDPLLHALVRSTACADILHDSLKQHLPRFGRALTTPGMAILLGMGRVDAQLERQGDEEARARGDLCCVLVQAGVRDERLLAVLWEHARAHPELYEEDLVHYGDPSVRPAILAEIQRRLNEPLPDAKGPYSALGSDLFPLANVYQLLGDALPPDVDRALQDLDARGASEFDQVQPAAFLNGDG